MNKIEDMILKIIGGSDFILWASMKISDEEEEFFKAFANGEYIKRQMLNFHLYEVKGTADKVEDTFHITADIFINNTRVFEAYTAISDIETDPDAFYNILEQAQATAMMCLEKSFSKFTEENNPLLYLFDQSGHIGDMIEEHMYAGTVADIANQASESGTDITDTQIANARNDTMAKKYHLKSADPKIANRTVQDMIQCICEYMISRYRLLSRLFMIQIDYVTTTSVDEKFEATTILDSIDAFDYNCVMFGTFSYYDDNVITMPRMESYLDDKDNNAIANYVNDQVLKTVYKTLDLIRLVTSNPVDITVQFSTKNTMDKKEEELWKYV